MLEFLVRHFRLDVCARGIWNELGVYVLLGVSTIQLAVWGRGGGLE